MGQQEIDIRILRYLNGEMDAEEKAAFEERLQLDVALQQNVALYKKLELGVKSYGKAQMKAELLAAQTSVLKSKNLKKYKPSINAGGGFNPLHFLLKSIIIVSIASVALIYFNKFPIKHELIEEAHQKLHTYDTLFETKYDTIWHTIPANEIEGGKAGDTIYVKPKTISTEESTDWE